MFCQNCGTKNNDASIFCENCGARLEKPVDAARQQEQPVQQEQAVQQEQFVQQSVQQEQYTQQPVQQEQYTQQPVQQAKPKKPVSKLVIAVAAEAVILVASIIVFFNIGNSVYGPEKVAEKFFVEVANQNFKEAYKALDVEENDFINEKAFQNAECNVELSEVTEYKVKSTRGGNDEKEIEILYKTKGSSSKRTYNISVNKQDDKNMLFFENWQISPDAMIANDFYVCVPTGAEVTVDGVKLGKDYLNKKESDEDFQYYEIPEIFAGEHQIVVTKEGMAEVRALVDTDDYGYSLYSMQMDEKVLEEAVDVALADFEAIYTAAAQEKKYDAVADLFSVDVDGEDDYEDFVYDLTGSSYQTLNRISFSNVEAVASESYHNTDKPCVVADIEFDYSVNYTEDWFGETTNETYDESSYMTLYLVYEDGKWLLEDAIGGYIY